MSEIPEDIKVAAWDAFMEGEKDHGARLTHIARVILAERERCAKTTQLWGCSVSDGTYSASEVNDICNTIGPNIADAIMRGTAP